MVINLYITTMSEQLTPEEALSRPFLETRYYYSPEDAQKQYRALPERERYQMAEVYREAFGGAPWYERFKCGGCGGFSASVECCAGAEMGEAYPVEELVQESFPRNMAEFTPGIVILAKDLMGKMYGFSTGGFTTVQSLVDSKYGGSQEILDAICERGVTPDTSMFYNNETCVMPTTQQKGMGTRLNAKRTEAARYLKADIICGRSINVPWLGVIQRQLGQVGYDFDAFTPRGDTYAVEGAARQFYIARRIPAQP
jgi:hypothetical protein